MKEGIKMEKKWIVFMMLGLFLSGCASLGGIEQREKIYGKGVPIIKESFASTQMSTLDNWKIYVNAEDPDGDMRYIVATIAHPGGGGYPATFIPIARENEKELDEVPQHVKKELKFVFIEHIDEVLKETLMKAAAAAK